MQVDFYHLAATPIERVLPRIGEKVVADGGRLLIVAEEPLLGRVDALLWTYGRDSFLPHGTDDAERQPILLSTVPEPANGARNIALADGRWREQALGFDRAFHFFDVARLDEARAAWRALAGREGVERRYWKQDDAGKWVQRP